MTNCEEDVHRIKRKLEKMLKNNEIDINTSMDMLNTLKKLPIDFEILKNTGIGVALNNLRKNCNSEELGALAKSLLKNWKKLVANESTNVNSSPNSNSNDSKPMSPNLTPTTTATTTNSTTNGNSKDQAQQNKHSNGSPNDVKTPIRTSTTDQNFRQNSFNNYHRSMSAPETKDAVRLKCREMLENALELVEAITTGEEVFDAKVLAARCEEAIFQEFKNTDVKYKNRIRSRIINLKDAKNPKLRENVRLGYITPERLATMSSEEMASDELKNLRAKFTQEAINDHQMARREGAKTSLLKCGKCKKNNVVYSEMQTRSADEPMTVFALCQECGHRWKFS